MEQNDEASRALPAWDGPGKTSGPLMSGLPARENEQRLENLMAAQREMSDKLNDILDRLQTTQDGFVAVESQIDSVLTEMDAGQR